MINPESLAAPEDILTTVENLHQQVQNLAKAGVKENSTCLTTYLTRRLPLAPDEGAEAYVDVMTTSPTFNLPSRTLKCGTDSVTFNYGDRQRNFGVLHTPEGGAPDYTLASGFDAADRAIFQKLMNLAGVSNAVELSAFLRDTQAARTEIYRVAGYKVALGAGRTTVTATLKSLIDNNALTHQRKLNVSQSSVFDFNAVMTLDDQAQPLLLEWSHHELTPGTNRTSDQMTRERLNSVSAAGQAVIDKVRRTGQQR